MTTLTSNVGILSWYPSWGTVVTWWVPHQGRQAQGPLPQPVPLPVATVPNGPRPRPGWVRHPTKRDRIMVNGGDMVGAASGTTWMGCGTQRRDAVATGRGRWVGRGPCACRGGGVGVRNKEPRLSYNLHTYSMSPSLILLGTVATGRGRWGERGPCACRLRQPAPNVSIATNKREITGDRQRWEAMGRMTRSERWSIQNRDQAVRQQPG
jgi:hypothetical protein